MRIGLIALIFLTRVLATMFARFTGDESYFWAIACRIARFQAAPVYGPPLTGSIALHPGPVFYYLIALPQLLGNSPYWGSILVALLHGLAGWMLYDIACRARGSRAGLVALALFALAPWDILYGDRIWLSCVAPVWGTAIAYVAVRVISSAGWGWQVGLVALALVCPQMHMSAPIIWSFALVLLLCGGPVPWRGKAICAGVLLAVAAYAPTIYAECASGFANTRAIGREGGGHASGSDLLEAPMRALGYVWLYASSEIGYQFARGYWAPFSETALYFSPSGWREYGALHGLWTPLNLISCGLAVAGWVSQTRALIVCLIQRQTSAVGRGCVRPLELEHALTLGLWVALLTAMALLLGARKNYFPHYTNLLMPIALWPVIASLDRWLQASASRVWAQGACALSILAMGSSVFRYYTQIDGLNGLGATLAMVDSAMHEVNPVYVQFDDFGNQFAWEMISEIKYRRTLTRARRATLETTVTYRVHNGARPSTEWTGARKFMGVAVDRVPPWPAL